MKIQPDHYAHMRDAIKATADALPSGTIADFRRRLTLAGREGCDVEMRIRWDLCRLAGLIPYLCSTIYDYADDSHIDTALRAIVRELKL